MSVADCPERERLAALLFGTLPEEEADHLVEHVEVCPDCETAIQALESESDTLIGRIRQPAPVDRLTQEPQCREALARAVGLGRQPPGASKCRAGPSCLGSLGQYELLEQLGRGGMGTVYKARHPKLDRVVALKVLPKQRMADQSAVARFEREMKAVGRLEHANIVRATDAGEAGGTPFLVMEYIDGWDLSELVRRLGPLPVAEACELVRQVAVGLQAAHEHGMVHRDVKPSNVMLTRGGEVKLLDLGLARFHLEPATGEEMTGTGQAMGTADYMAPEQTSDSRDVDIRADVYSLGCTLYRLLSGRAPFAGPNYRGAFEKMSAHVHEPVPPIGQFRDDVPPSLAALLDRMLAKDPDGRPATPAEVADALEPICDGCDLSGLADRAQQSQPADKSPSQLPASRPQPLTAPRRRRLTAIAIGLMLLGVGAGFALGIVITIEKNGQTTTVTITDDDGEVKINGKSDAEPLAAHEGAMKSLPDYRIEPPDVLQIEMLKQIPLPPYHVQTYDVLRIDVMGTLVEHPISNSYLVEAEGTVNFGAAYGAVRVEGMTIEKVKLAIDQHLGRVLKEPSVAVQVARHSSMQPVTGQYLVGPDGTVNLRQYGLVSVTGMTVGQAKAALEKKLAEHFQSPEVSVNVMAYNSKVYYVITEGGNLGDNIVRLPITGKETVLDAISAIGGLSQISSKRIWIARPTPGDSRGELILRVDWNAITRGANTATNFQVMPGDRIYISLREAKAGEAASPAKSEAGMLSWDTFDAETFTFEGGATLSAGTASAVAGYNERPRAVVPASDAIAILVAREHIPADTALTPELLVLEVWPKDKVPNGVLTRVEEITDRRTRVGIHAGDPIAEKYLLAAEWLSFEPPVPTIPEGYRAVSVTVDATDGDQLKVSPGDRVDVLIVPFEDGTVKSPARTVLEDVKVFSARWATLLNVAPPVRVKNVSLLLTPEQAEKLRLATEQGKLRIVPRALQEDARSDLKPIQGTWEVVRATHSAQRAPRHVYVLGEVATPGQFELGGPTTVLQAIAMADSWNDGSHLRQVVVRRCGDDRQLIVMLLDLEAALHGNQPCPAGEIRLSDSDTVIVPKSPILVSDGTMWLDGKKHDTAALVEVLQTRLKERPGTSIQLRCSPEVPFKIVTGLMNTLKEAGATDISFAVRPRQEAARLDFRIAPVRADEGQPGLDEALIRRYNDRLKTHGPRRDAADEASVDLLSGLPIATADLPAVEAALAAAGLHDYKILGGTIRVPREKEAACMAALADANALPSSLDKLRESVRQRYEQLNSEQLKIAKQKALSLTITSMRGIEWAAVLYDTELPPGPGRDKVTTATVSVKAADDAQLDRTQVSAIRSMVAGAIEGLKPEQVTVTDLNGPTYHDDPGSREGTADGPNVRLKRVYEQQWKAKIQEALAYVPDVNVTVSVELDVPAELDAGLEPDVRVTPLTPRSIAVSVNVPRSYLEQVWQTRNPSAEGAARSVPSREALDTLQEEETDKIRKSVATLLPSAEDADPVELVSVNVFDEAGGPADDSFAWFELKSVPSEDLITATYQNRRYVLLSNSPAEVMLSGSEGRRTWGLRGVSQRVRTAGGPPVQPKIAAAFDQPGTVLFAAFTEAHVGGHLAVLVDDRVVCIPKVMTKMGGEVEITGISDEQESQRLVRALQAGMVRPTDGP